MPRLPLTDQPRADESLDSWLEYLADLMSCTVRELLSMCDINPGRRFAGFTTGVDDNFAGNLTAATGSPIDAIHRATVARYAETLGTDGTINPILLTGCSTKFCPRCLTDNGGRWKLIWHLRTSAVCREHCCLLLDQCPRCGGKPRMTTSRKPQALRPPGQRSGGLCGIHGCMDALVEAPAPLVSAGSAVLSQQLWIDSAIHHPHVSIPALAGLSEQTVHVMRDIVAIKTAAGRETALGSPGGEAPSLYNSPSAPADQLFGDIHHQDQTSPHLIGEAVAQTLLVNTYTAPDRDAVIDNLDWLPSNAARRACYFRPASDSRGSTVGPSTRRLIYHREMASSASNPLPLWHTEILQTAGVHPLPTAALPSRMWPSVVSNHPPVTGSAQNLLPLTSVISLAALGHHGRPVHQRRAFDIIVDAHRLDVELQSLWSGDNVAQILDYYLALHEHLRSQPPPIDYARRRRQFPNPTALYGKSHRHPNPARFVWQLLTGSDPFSTLGAARRFGPIIDHYCRFAENLTPRQKSVLIEEARRLLITSGITDEPVIYAPAHDGSDFRRRETEELKELTIDDALIPGTHIIALRSASQDRTPEAVLQFALNGDSHLAEALVHFTTTAGQHQVTAARRAGRRQVQLAEYEDVLEVHLGRVLHTRGRRGNPRALTTLGIQLRDTCLPHLEQLSRVAGVPIPTSPPTAIDND